MNTGLTLSSLRDRGYKITSIRKGIVDVFSDTDKPLSAAQLYYKLHKRKLNVNKTTVYRELQFLVNENYLIEVHLTPQETSYELAELLHHHHLICDVCGDVDKVTECLPNRLEDDVLKNKGFRISRHSLEFYGVCANCAKNS